MGWHPNLTRPCGPDCACGKHNRTPLHNELIGRGVRRALDEKLLRTDCGLGADNPHEEMEKHRESNT